MHDFLFPEPLILLAQFYVPNKPLILNAKKSSLLCVLLEWYIITDKTL